MLSAQNSRRSVKLLLSVLACTLVFSAAACHKNETDNSAATTSTTSITNTTNAATTHTESQANLQGDLPQIDYKNYKYIYSLTGLPAENNPADLPIVITMLDNHDDARPQAGLTQADIVYEQRVEGPYTRYMAVFQSQPCEKIGPLRSARINFLERLAEYNAVYAHVGGSNEALDKLRNSNDFNDVDAMFVSSSVMWRDSSDGHFAPHNVYSSYDVLLNSAQQFSYDTTPEAPEFNFNHGYKHIAEAQAKDIKQVTITFNKYNISTYEYDSQSASWLRSSNDAADLDSNDGSRVAPTNLIVQFADAHAYDSAGHIDVMQIGSGSGYLFSAGDQVDIRWEKQTYFAPTKFYYAKTGNAAGNSEIKLNPGQTWIVTVDNSSAVDFS